MTDSLEQHLRELGLMPEKKPVVIEYICPKKFYFYDPRDPVTGEVPF